MARPLRVRKPTLRQLRRLQQLLESEASARQRRRAEVLLLYAAGHDALSMAQALQVHPQTIYADLRAFQQHGLRSVAQVPLRGAVARFSPAQRNEMVRLADTTPAELGLPWGRWSLAKLRDYLQRHKMVRSLSREHLRRILKKGACRCAGSGANSSASTRSGRRF
jgi:transposase